MPFFVEKYAEPVEPFCVVEAYPSVVSPVTLRVPVAIKFASDTLPEKRPLPWTERSDAGEVVPMPTLPIKKLFEVEVACNHPNVGVVDPLKLCAVPEDSMEMRLLVVNV